MPTKRSPTRFLIALVTLFTLPAQAQEDRWYEVELLIFSQPANNADEQWDPLPQLTYPETGRFLLYPQQIAAQREQHAGPSEVDELGRLWLQPPIDSQTTFPDTAEAPAPEDIAPEQAVHPPPATAETTAAEDATPRTPRPFVALPHGDSAFSDKAAYMQRAGNYRTLFHERWVQPVRDEATALPLYIDRSGDVGDWPALQGSVKIHLSRYLHLETNLWLNTQGEYLVSRNWQMPAPPLGPASVRVQEVETILANEGEPGTPDAYPAASGEPVGLPDEGADNVAESGVAEGVTEGVTEGVAEGVADGIEEGDADTAPYLLEDDRLVMPADDELGMLADEAAGPVYPWRHAVLLKQDRRMRSNETHYVDHPLLGVVIKFTPLDEERLQAMADAEQKTDVAHNAGPAAPR